MKDFTAVVIKTFITMVSGFITIIGVALVFLAVMSVLSHYIPINKDALARTIAYVLHPSLLPLSSFFVGIIKQKIKE